MSVSDSQTERQKKKQHQSMGTATTSLRKEVEDILFMDLFIYLLKEKNIRWVG